MTYRLIIISTLLIGSINSWGQDLFEDPLSDGLVTSKQTIGLDDIELDDVLRLFSSNEIKQAELLNKISSNWKDEYYAPMLEVVRMASDPFLLDNTLKLLREKSNGEIANFYDGLQWLWNNDFETADFYADLKASLYKYIDPKFQKYFEGRGDQSIIEFDEILWGGVVQDGIPPLRYPKMIKPNEANYLQDDAYKSYFSTDELMFPVPLMDDRLKNKSELFVLKIDGYKIDPIAVSIDYLKKINFHHDQIGTKSFVLLTEPDGLTRAYESEGVQFKSYRKGKLLDGDKNQWIIEDGKLISPSGKYLNRLAGHNIFWFAWLNAFPETRLVF